MGIETMAAMSLASQVGIGSSVLGGVTGFIGNKNKGKAAKQQAAYQAQLLQQNAKIARRQQVMVQDKADADIQARSVETSATASVQKTQTAGAGIVVNQDTAATTESDTIRAGTLDQIAIQRNADLEKWSLQVKANSAMNQSALALTAGENAKKAADTEAIGSLLSSAGSVAGKWAVA